MAGKVLDSPRARSLLSIIFSRSTVRFLALPAICRNSSIQRFSSKSQQRQSSRFCLFSDAMIPTVSNRWLRIPQFFRFRSTLAAPENQKPVITLFSKDDCPLCDVAKEELKRYQDQCKIEVIDIGDEKNSLWFEKYKYDIPVIHLNGKFLMKHKVFDGALEDAIVNANAKTREIEKNTIAPGGKRHTKFLENKSSDMMLNFYSGHFLDRCANIRKSRETVDAKMRRESSRFIIFSSLEPLLSKRGNKPGYCLKTLSFKEVSELLNDDRVLDEVVLLGTDSNNIDWFAINLRNNMKQDVISSYVKADAKFSNAFSGMLKLNDVESSIAAQARGVLAWHSSHRFCPECGSESEMAEAGYRRQCSNEKCRTRYVNNHHACYPRVDPVTMSLVVSPDQKSILLARKPIFPPGFFTCLAGFVEPGESFETAAHREVYEECGIEIDNISYQLSQCWPFPSSIMFGCSATAKHTDIVIDDQELEDAIWFTKEQAISLISKETHKAFVAGKRVEIAPGKYALAHHLIKRWIDGKI
eukprot:gene5908-11246_t